MSAQHPTVDPVSVQGQRPMQSDRSIAKRWNHQKLFDNGFVAVPSRFLQLYARLKPYPLTTGEALFVLHLMEFKWDESSPFPGYKTLAARMGVTDKMTRRYAQSLETKKYLRREARVGQTNRFDLTPLFNALALAVDQESKQKRRTKAKKQSDDALRNALLNWHQTMLTAYRSMSPAEMADLALWEREHLGEPGVTTSDWPGWEKLIGSKPS
jgi:predicted GIY-YIG superfamily endonuclease